MSTPLYKRLLEQEEVNSTLTSVGSKLCVDAVENVRTFSKGAVKCGYRIYGNSGGAQCAKTHNACAILECPFSRSGARRELTCQHANSLTEIKEFLHL